MALFIFIKVYSVSYLHWLSFSGFFLVISFPMFLYISINLAFTRLVDQNIYLHLYNQKWNFKKRNSGVDLLIIYTG